MIEANATRARLIIEELVHCGVTQFIISPGFRSAPLALAATSHPLTHVTVHYDERGSAFFALGYGRAARTPCVWLTTSGTATANGFPAVIEASMDDVPLICLTADRPSELRDTGSNQTIDQVHLFGRYPVWFADLPASMEELDESYVRTTMNYAIHQSRSGPVHLNCMLREPLIEMSDQHHSIPTIEWAKKNHPYTSYSSVIPESFILEDHLCQKITSAQRGLMISGRLQTLEEGSSIGQLADHLDWPLLADICAPISETRNSVHFFDLIVRNPSFVENYRPDVILHLGGPFVSKKLQKYIVNSEVDSYMMISSSSKRIDPSHIVTHRIEATISSFCDAIVSSIPPNQSNSDWLDTWIQTDAIVQEALTSQLELEISEPSVAWMLSNLLDSTDWIFCASSMPIRDLQSFFRRKHQVRVFANRGASGIDGTLSTVAGISQAIKGRGIVLLGDLAMLHDLNSLTLLKEKNVTIIVLNNNGGGIFHMLPIALPDQSFEKVLGTPHDMDFYHVAQQFQIPYSKVHSCDQFQQLFHQAKTTQGPCILEVQTDRQQNAHLHNTLYDCAVDAV